MLHEIVDGEDVGEAEDWVNVDHFTNMTQLENPSETNNT